MKPTFAYISLNNPEVPKGPFKAGKHAGTWYPMATNRDWADDKGRRFIYGMGWVRLTGLRDIPLCDTSDTQHLIDYAAKWGHECLFYSLTGCKLTDNGDYQREYKHAVWEYLSAKFTGVENICDFAAKCQHVNHLLLSAYKERYGLQFSSVGSMWPLLNGARVELKDERFTYTDLEATMFWCRPHHCLYIMSPHSQPFAVSISGPYLEPFIDDRNLEKAANALLKIIKAYNIPCPLRDAPAFPDAMNARMELLFGPEVVEAYREVLSHNRQFVTQ